MENDLRSALSLLHDYLFFVQAHVILLRSYKHSLHNVSLMLHDEIVTNSTKHELGTFCRRCSYGYFWRCRDYQNVAAGF